MPNIRPISDLRNSSNEISEFCRVAREPVFITQNGVGDMVVMSIEVLKNSRRSWSSMQNWLKPKLKY